MLPSSVFRSTSPFWRDLGIVIGLTVCIQFALYGSSFLGNRVLLPLEVLTYPGKYLSVDLKGHMPPSLIRADLIEVSEIQRRFIASEFRAGRIPLWTPYAYAGTPLARASIFSPFELLYVIWPSPRVLPWMQLAASLVAATGCWRFAASILKLGSVAAMTAGVCYPLTGFLMLWQGFDISYPVHCFPWQALAAISLIGQPCLSRIVTLALVTALTIISGPADMAGEVLLMTGCLWVWRAIAHAIDNRSFLLLRYPVIATTTGWVLGFLLAAPVLLPLAEYVRTGIRFASRDEGVEERPPVGWKALPLLFFADAYGSEREGSLYFQGGNRLESAAGSHAGCLALLFAVPWAWKNRRLRGWVWCLSGLTLLALSWQLDVPGMVSLWRMPGLKLFSANRFVFAGALSIILLASIGIDQMSDRTLQHLSWPNWLGIAMTATSLLVFVYCFIAMPEDLKNVFPKRIIGEEQSRVRAEIVTGYAWQLGRLMVCVVAWFTAWRFVNQNWFSRMFPVVVSGLMILDLITLSWNLHSQSDPGLYYPRLAALEFIQHSPPGRVLGVKCFPPRLLESHQLQDVRGYDGVDPLVMIDLLKPAIDKNTVAYNHALLANYAPELLLSKSSPPKIKVHPTLDMLGVRYLIFNQSVTIPGPEFVGDGYCVYVNQNAMPRAWVPRKVTLQPSRRAVLNFVRAWNFSPAEEAFTNELPLPLSDDCSGEVAVVHENPQSLTLSANMQTPGMVVIGDRYAAGWQVTVNGQRVPLMCVNYLLRGVNVPAGELRIELHYRPASFTLGLQLCFFAIAVLLSLGISAYWHQNRCLTQSIEVARD